MRLGLGLGVTARSAGSTAPAPFVGPFDAYATNIAAAFEVRRLFSAYEGPLLRVLRNDDDAEMDFGFDPSDPLGLLDTTAMAAWAGVSSLLVMEWYDQSGNGKNFVQLTKANMPLFQPAGFKSKPTLSFDGVNDRLITSSTVALGAHNLLLIGKWNFNGDALLVEHGIPADSKTYLNVGRTTTDYPHLVQRYPTPGVGQGIRHNTRLANNVEAIVSYAHNGTRASQRYVRNGVAQTITSTGGDAGTGVEAKYISFGARSDGSLPVPGVASGFMLWNAYSDETVITVRHGIANSYWGVY